MSIIIAHFKHSLTDHDSCVADALTDLDNHEILKMASDHVDEQRRVGVFTKCDMIKPESSLARKVSTLTHSRLLECSY